MATTVHDHSLSKDSRYRGLLQAGQIGFSYRGCNWENGFKANVETIWVAAGDVLTGLTSQETSSPGGLLRPVIYKAKS